MKPSVSKLYYAGRFLYHIAKVLYFARKLGIKDLQIDKLEQEIKDMTPEKCLVEIERL